MIATSSGEIGAVAREIAQRTHARRTARAAPLPSRDAAGRLIDLAKDILFPCASFIQGDLTRRLEATLASFRALLEEQVRLALAAQSVDRAGAEAQRIANAFISQFPHSHELLMSDLQAAYRGDPALETVEEAVLCYPGVAAVLCYRIARALHELGVPLLPRMITQFAHSNTGIDIHPGATIGRGFFIDHGTGVVVGGTAIIGDNVRLYQGVTLGARSFPTDANGEVRKGLPRHPIIEDDVVIYSWASVLGRITIGRGSVIGGSVWVTRDVPPGSFITQAKAERAVFADGSGI